MSSTPDKRTANQDRTTAIGVQINTRSYEGTSTLIIKRLMPATRRDSTPGWRVLVQHRRVVREGTSHWLREWRWSTETQWHYRGGTRSFKAVKGWLDGRL